LTKLAFFNQWEKGRNQPIKNTLPILEMNSLVGEERANIKKLYESGCCIKCGLLFIEFPTFDIFLKRESEVTKAFGFDYDEKRVCSSCLGIFQDVLLFDTLPRLTKEKISQFEHDNFLVSIFCPHSIVLRQYALHKLIGKKCNDGHALYVH
jgi:hypothetical protein